MEQIIANRLVPRVLKTGHELNARDIFTIL
jgi:hypothetical protein